MKPPTKLAAVAALLTCSALAAGPVHAAVTKHSTGSPEIAGKPMTRPPTAVPTARPTPLPMPTFVDPGDDDDTPGSK